PAKAAQYGCQPSSITPQHFLWHWGHSGLPFDLYRRRIVLHSLRLLSIPPFTLAGTFPHVRQYGAVAKNLSAAAAAAFDGAAVASGRAGRQMAHRPAEPGVG